MNRNLDGLYFRVNRDGKWCNVCFSDLTFEEREQIVAGKSAEWLRSVCYHLADVLKDTGENFNITGGLDDE